jgi:hypothetical protein
MSPNVSEKHIASILRVDKISSARNQRKQVLAHWFLAELILSTLKMGAIYSSEMVDTQRTTWRYIPEDGTLHNHHFENIKSYL